MSAPMGWWTLDVAQEVSGVQPETNTNGINSPTFSERAVTSRVSIQDGQTIGLAGLISDSDSHQNQGIPYLKNVPVLGALFSTQNNERTRTELLVLITPACGPHASRCGGADGRPTRGIAERRRGAGGIAGATLAWLLRPGCQPALADPAIA